MQSEAKFLREKMFPMLGGRLVALVVDGSTGEDTLGLVFEAKDKTQTVVWVQRDAEGNGPGWLEVSE